MNDRPLIYYSKAPFFPSLSTPFTLSVASGRHMSLIFERETFSEPKRGLCIIDHVARPFSKTPERPSPSLFLFLCRFLFLQLCLKVRPFARLLSRLQHGLDDSFAPSARTMTNFSSKDDNWAKMVLPGKAKGTVTFRH